ncbi:hypothetical protein [Lysinibacillus sp. NPDC093688]
MKKTKVVILATLLTIGLTTVSVTASASTIEPRTSNSYNRRTLIIR